MTQLQILDMADRSPSPLPGPIRSGNTPRISCCDINEGRESGGIEGAPKLLQCGLCNALHHRRCIEFDYGEVRLSTESQSFWLCPRCSLEPMHRWNDT